MNSKKKAQLKELSARAGLNSPASAALLTQAEFSEHLGTEVTGYDAKRAWETAKEERNDLLILEKNILTRASPLLPQAVRQGLKHPDVSLRDYEEWFGRKVAYANPGDVSSVYSPAAYLVELYREARHLYPEGARWNIDTRRPDLAKLDLSQQYMDQVVTALSLSNEILMPHISDQLISDGTLAEGQSPSFDKILEALSQHLQSGDTPYDHHHARLRQVRIQKDPDFKHLLAAPQVFQYLSGVARAALLFNLPPSLCSLLTEVLPDNNGDAEDKFESYFPSMTPEELLQPKTLRRLFDLTDEDIRYFIDESGQYAGNNLSTIVDNTDGKHAPAAQAVINADSNYLDALKLNKIIRLYKATGIAPRVLKDIVNSINPDAITIDTLALLFQTALLMKRYGIPHEEALVMAKGLISLTSHESESSQFDRLFNLPPLIEGGFQPNPGTIVLKPGDAGVSSEIKAVLKRAMQTDDEGLYSLIMIYHRANTEAELTLNLNDISGIYTLSLWARLHGLTPYELQQVLLLLDLPQKLFQENAAVWGRLLEKLYATIQWLAARRWSVYELQLMVRDVKNIPSGVEIQNFINQLREFVLGSGETEPNARIQRLAPFISGIFSLNSDSAAVALLEWAGEAKPGGWTVNDMWLFYTGEEVIEDHQVAFSYGLAQLALIYQGTGITPYAFEVFVTNPSLLGLEAGPVAGVLNRNLYVVKALSELSDWLKALPDADMAAQALIGALADKGIDATLLAKAIGVDALLVGQAMEQAALHAALKDATTLFSYAQVQAVIQWIKLATAFGVTPAALGKLLTLSYSGSLAATWTAWKLAADTFEAGLTPTQSRAADDAVQEGLSAALCGYLLHSDSSFAGIITTREELYQYLLADNLNGSQITTSRVAEAINALQTFIHRSLSSPEGVDALNRDGPGRQFFLDWQEWNSRYSHWSAYRKLMYYPENYLDPTVRLGQTRMMDEMLQSLGQAQINADTVGDAFMTFLDNFEKVANLTTLCGYHDNANPDSGKTWFIGHDQSEVREYSWRTVDEGKRKRDNTGVLPSNAWTGWEKITCSPQVWSNFLRPVVYKSRLYLAWVEQQDTSYADQAGNKVEQWRWLLKISEQRYDRNWSAPVTKDVTTALKKLILIKKAVRFYVSVWAPTDTILVIAYEEEAALYNETNAVGWSVFDDMDIADFDADQLSSTLTLLKDTQQLQTGDHNPVINKYIGAQVVPENKWVSSSSVPPGFSDYSLLIQSLTAASNNVDTTYTLDLQVKADISFIGHIGTSAKASKVIEKFPELAKLDTLVNFTTFSDVDFGNNYGTETQKADVSLIRNEDNIYIVVELKGTWPYAFKYGAVSVWGSDGRVEAFYSIPLTIDDSSVAHFHVKGVDINLDILNIAVGITDSTSSTQGHYMTGWLKSISWIPFNPSKLLSIGNAIPKENITVKLDSESVPANTDWTVSNPWTGVFNVKLENFSIEDNWSGNSHIHRVEFEISNYYITGKALRTYEVRVHRDTEARLVVTLHSTPNKVQYLQFGEDTKVTRLNTLFARHLTERASTGIRTILNWETQQIQEPPMVGSDYAPMDFAGANGIYFWELFYYTPMMVMQRFLLEERFDLAEQWLGYVFNPGGYLVEFQRTPRLWNVRPLHEDTSWNDSPLESYDPDAVAQNDPMHYKLNAFMQLLNITIGRGDAAYRKLERDTLAEAKVWYSLALNLLGEKPWIAHNSDWTDPTLGKAAKESRQMAHLDTLSALYYGQPIPEGANREEAEPIQFLPEANDVMLGYWETLRLRLYNLRHNLTIDGQPLNLQLFAAVADPKALLSAAVAAEAGAGSELPTVDFIPALRFTPLLESARSMASQLIQFGSSLQQILISQDSEALAELLTRQGAEIADSSLSLQKQTLNELAAERVTLEKNLDAVTTRRDHYLELYNENVNSREQLVMDLLTSSQSLRAGIKPLYVAGAVSGLAPNIFGLANGGMKYAGPLNAAGIGVEIAADVLDIVGGRIAQEEQYRRRRQEWDIQYRSADKEMVAIEAQLSALAIRETSAQMQIAHMETQTAQAAAQLALLQGKFTGKTMYSWLRARLATVFYQYYDLTASCCLMAQKALQWEKGVDDTTIYLRTGTWNGAWAGLMSGEGLMLSLAQMETAWMKHQKREMEVTRTVSLAQFFLGDPAKLKLIETIRTLLETGAAGEVGPELNKVVLTTEGQLAVHFNLKDLGLTRGFSDRSCRIRSIAVSLPAVLGPYQNIHGRLLTKFSSTKLPAGCNECAISHGMQDNGLFLDGGGDPRWGARWQPFEGLKADDASGMTLSLEDATSDQKSLLQSLNDIILHVQFTVY